MHSRLKALLARAAIKSASLYSPSHLRNSRVVPIGDYTTVANVVENNVCSKHQSLSRQPVLSRRRFCGYAAEQFSDDEYECDYENHPPSSSVANIDEWKWKISMLLQNDTDQEIISRDKRDKRDFEQISNLAKRMGLYCQLYGKVIVASKVPLPNYRPDLDDKRPQREVVIPLSLQRRVESLLQEHLDRTSLNSKKACQISNEIESTNPVENVDSAEHADPFLDASVMEKVLQRRSLRLRNMQRTWQACISFECDELYYCEPTYCSFFDSHQLGDVGHADSLVASKPESPEGRRMLDFRKSLPAFKEKERLLQAIARNQVVVISGETGCGKTTQLPQYILEANIESGRGAFCNIICTQPRRISAMTVAERVSAERGEPLGESVGLLSVSS
ncbi:hypothetical protein SASPL_120319 [Salvia splendens]|uniref:RNA helicase n=1 Tax=Salvia splendens TaxID=180675 RepID=A0A8X8XQ99_SALSN|nr:hypothetical protein SASPL_120319 [Salvia splendens]